MKCKYSLKLESCKLKELEILVEKIKKPRLKRGFICKIIYLNTTFFLELQYLII